MATRNVPGTYPTISAAVAAAVAGDTILVAAGYAGNEAVSVTVNNLTFSAPSSVPGIVLTAAAGILKITLAGASPIRIIGNSGNNSFTGNTGANIITDGGGGDDILKGGGGDDTITVTGGTDTVDGGAGTNDLLIVDYSTATTSVSSSSTAVTDGGTRTVNFQNVERLQITGGSGDDILAGLSGDDILSGGAGNDLFKLGPAYSPDAGTIDGGTGTDTVLVSDLDPNGYYNLINYDFSNVEILDANGSGRFYGTIAQLSSFSTLTDSIMPANAMFSIGLNGEGGTIDFSTRVTGQHSVRVQDYPGDRTTGYTIIGTANGDLLYGSEYDDTLIGGDGDDKLDGREGANTVDGGNGNDTITDYYGSGGTLIGGAGDDHFFQLYGSDSTIDGGMGIDTVETADLGGYSFSNVEILIISSEYVNGTAAQLSSFSTLNFSAWPNDFQLMIDLKGSGGTLDLSTRITGQHSAHVVDQGVTAGYTVTGTVNGDWLQGSAYNDSLDGGAGDDILSGGDGMDLLHGGAGNDTLTGGAGLDTLVGGTGNDVLNGNSDGDTASYDDATAGVKVNLGTTSAQNTVGAGTDTLSGISNLIGSRFADQLTGDGTANHLNGGAGADWLTGNGGADTMFGGAGNDTYSVDDAGDVVREDSTPGVDDGGLDLVNASVSFTLGSFVENLTLTGSGAIDGTGNGLDNKIIGNAGANHLFGGAGVDTLTGGAGADTMDGGDGGDFYNAAVGDVIHDTGSSGTDTVIATTNLTLNPGSGIENLTAASGSTGNFTLTGDEGNNRVAGNAGNNVLRGLVGNDTLLGGAGTDTLVGGTGRDTMVGGTGADSFIFGNSDSLVAQFDRINDFVSGTDKIDLGIVGAGGLDPSAYAETSVASNNFNTIKAAALALMAGGDKSAVFVAGMADGYLFWNTDANHTTIEAGVRLAGVNTLAGLQVTDLT